MNTIYDGTFVLGSTSSTTFSAGNGITITQPSEGTIIIGNDETVLFESTTPTAEANLSESWKNFDHLKICVQNTSNDNGWTYVEIKPLEREGYTPYYNIVAGFSYGLGTNGMIWQNIIGSASDTKLTNCSSFGFQNSWTATSVTVRKNNSNDINCIRKVIGINRIGGNE